MSGNDDDFGTHAERTAVAVEIAKAQVSAYLAALGNNVSNVKADTTTIMNYVSAHPKSGFLRCYVDPSISGFDSISGQLGYVIKKFVQRSLLVFQVLEDQVDLPELLDSLVAEIAAGRRPKVASFGCGPSPEVLGVIFWLKIHGVDIARVDFHASDLFDWSIAMNALIAHFPDLNITFHTNVDVRKILNKGEQAHEFLKLIDGCAILLAEYVLVEQIRGSKNDMNVVEGPVKNFSPHTGDVKRSCASDVRDGANGGNDCHRPHQQPIRQYRRAILCRRGHNV